MKEPIGFRSAPYGGEYASFWATPEYEIAERRASALGRRLEAALAAFAACPTRFYIDDNFTRDWGARYDEDCPLLLRFTAG
jgi:hypothetical protein